MRDPNRIPEMIQTLERIMTANPDLRMGQILVGAAQAQGWNTDIFHTEDDSMLEALLQYEEFTKAFTNDAPTG